MVVASALPVLGVCLNAGIRLAGNYGDELFNSAAKCQSLFNPEPTLQQVPSVVRKITFVITNVLIFITHYIIFYYIIFYSLIKVVE